MREIDLNNYTIEENSNGDFVVTHDPSGAEFRYDSDSDQWILGLLSVWPNQAAIEPAAQDLSNLTLGSTEDGRLYHHDGNSSIDADGGTTSSPGYYVWSNGDSEFKSAAQY